MANLTEAIEQYLKGLIAASREGSIEVQRSLLAEMFSCAPSQINYVLATRFLLEHGYLVETKRGGGGYVRITLLALDSQTDWNAMLDLIGQTISQPRAEAIIARLEREGLVSSREADLMLAATHRDVLTIGLPWRDLLRAQILRSMLVALRKYE